MAFGSPRQHRDGCVLSHVAGQEDLPPPGNRFREAWCPVGRTTGTPSPQNASQVQPPPGTGSWLLTALWKGSQIPLHKPSCIPRGPGEGAEMYQSFLFQAWLLIQLPSPVKFTICHHTLQLFALLAKGLGASADICGKQSGGPVSILTSHSLSPDAPLFLTGSLYPCFCYQPEGKNTSAPAQELGPGIKPLPPLPLHLLSIYVHPGDLLSSVTNPPLREWGEKKETGRVGKSSYH